MAGDWIQIDCDLPEKTETQLICDRAECHVDVTLGRLVLLWRWVDRHAGRELIAGATVATLCRVALGDEKFWRAVESVGWLKIEGDGIRIPKWSKRFGTSSKSRAMAARRQRLSRANRNGHVTRERDESVTKTSPREEKSRVEKSREELSISTALTEWLVWWNDLKNDGIVAAGVDAEKPAKAIVTAWRRAQDEPELRAALSDRTVLAKEIRASGRMVKSGWFSLAKLLHGKNQTGEWIAVRLLDGAYRDQERQTELRPLLEF